MQRPRRGVVHVTSRVLIVVIEFADTMKCQTLRRDSPW